MIIQTLSKAHDRASFSCRIDYLDRYLKTQANQDMQKRAAVTYVLTQPENSTIVGFYSLASTSVLPSAMPTGLSKKLPKYEKIPAVLLGRLAVDIRHRNNGFGSVLLVDALKRSLSISTQVGVVAVMVDAKSNEAAAFYKHFGFIPMQDAPLTLCLPVATIQQLPE